MEAQADGGGWWLCDAAYLAWRAPSSDGWFHPHRRRPDPRTRSRPWRHQLGPTPASPPTWFEACV